MAEAGFYFVGSDDDPDLARCYYCRRELGGWEPEDDPWAEHGRRACPFIDLGKDTAKLTREDVYKLEVEKNCHVVVSVRWCACLVGRAKSGPWPVSRFRHILVRGLRDEEYFFSKINAAK